MVPSDRTSSSPVTWFVVTPYASVCGPPEFSATLPPRVQAFWLDGSGTKYRPCGAAAVDRWRLTRPGCTTARRFGTSTSRMRDIRANEITTPPSTGMAPPERPVPAPRGTSGTPCSAQKRASFATSAVSFGRTTASGVAISTAPSYSYRRRSSRAHSTFSAPRRSRSAPASSAPRRPARTTAGAAVMARGPRGPAPPPRDRQPPGASAARTRRSAAW